MSQSVTPSSRKTGGKRGKIKVFRDCFFFFFFLFCFFSLAADSEELVDHPSGIHRIPQSRREMKFRTAAALKQSSGHDDLQKR